MACLDTTVLLDLAGRGGRRRRAAAEETLKRLEHDQPHSVTRFTLAELWIGVEQADDPKRERAALDRFLTKLQVLEFDAASTRAYAILFVYLRKLGRLPGTMDTLIAAVTIAHGQRLVTRNTRHFTGIPGLRISAY